VPAVCYVLINIKKHTNVCACVCECGRFCVATVQSLKPCYSAYFRDIIELP